MQSTCESIKSKLRVVIVMTGNGAWRSRARHRDRMGIRWAPTRSGASSSIVIAAPRAERHA